VCLTFTALCMACGAVCARVGVVRYMATVNPNLALNLYTAVSNPITLEGRVKMCRSALAGSDVAPLLAPPVLPVPLVLLQSTENALVNASNVDPFLEGRAASHLWSHQVGRKRSAEKSSKRVWKGARTATPNARTDDIFLYFLNAIPKVSTTVRRRPLTPCPPPHAHSSC